MRNGQQTKIELALGDGKGVERSAHLKHLGAQAVAVPHAALCDGGAGQAMRLHTLHQQTISRKRKDVMATNAATVQKLQYQLKKAETDVEGWKRKEKAKREEFLALQQGVTNKQKQLQQRINRLEQEVLEGKRARDVLQREYQVTLQQVIDLGKTDDKAAPLAQTVARLSEEMGQLRAALEASAALARDWESKALAAQTATDLARAEKDAAVRAAEETEVAAQQLREVLKEERGAGASAGGSGGGKPLKGRTCLIFGGGETTILFCSFPCFSSARSLGSSGNGRAVARYLSEQGARVAVADANEAEAQKIVKVPKSLVVCVSVLNSGVQELRDVGGDVEAVKFDELRFGEAAKKTCELWKVSQIDCFVNALALAEERKSGLPEALPAPEIEFDKAVSSLAKTAFAACNQEMAFLGKKGKIVNFVASSPPGVAKSAGGAIALEVARQAVGNVTRAFAANCAAEKGARVFAVSAGKSESFGPVISFLCSDGSDAITGMEFNLTE